MEGTNNIVSHLVVARTNATKWLHNSHITNVVWKVVFPVQLAIIVIITLRLTTVLLGGGASYEEFHNTYCLQNTNPNITGPKINGTYEEDCVYDYKFQKVLYFWCDGISWDTAGPIFDQFPSNNNLFKVKHIQNPWSAWIFATFMTGKAERNMGDVKNDNLMYQFYLAGLKAFIGAEQTRSYVFSQLDLTFQHRSDNIKFYDRVSPDEQRMFHWLFECQSINKSEYDCMSQVLNQAKATERSMFFESFILDHVVHQQLTKYGKDVVRLRDTLATDLGYVKRWIDANPEYLLVVVSDHGQKSSAAEVDIHGNWRTNGNEGWAMFYNPNVDLSISTATAPITLNTVDVAPTFWQFFSANGVSLPAESVGKVYPVTNSMKTRYKALKTNAQQIRAYIARENTITYPDTLWDRANEYYHEGLYEQAAVALDDYITGITNKFYEEGAKLPYGLPMVSALLYLVLALVLQFGSRDSLWATARTAGYGLLASPYLAWIIIAVFFSQSSDKQERHEVYTYTIPMCAFLAAYTFNRLSRSPSVPRQKKDHKLLKFELLEIGAESVTIEAEKDDETVGYDESDNFGASEEEVSIPKVEEEKPFLYFEIYDRLKQRKLFDALLALINYVFGSQKVPRSPVDFWLMYSVVMFAIFSCFEIAFTSKRFIFEDIGFLYRHPPFWHTVALSVLFLEFRWQRILLTSNLELTPEKKEITLLQQLIHPAFLPLNLKMVGYFALLVLAFDANGSTARVIYGVTFVHIAILLVCPTYLQRDLFLPLFVLIFLINSSQEKILMCMYVVVLTFFSNAFEKPSATNRQVFPFIVVIMVAVGHYYFSVLYKLPYSMNQISLTIPGIEDITKYPNFSVLIMGLHYMGVFLMLIPFLIRLVTPSPPPLHPFKFGCFTLGHVPISPLSDLATAEHTRDKRYVMTLLMFCSSLTVFLYYLFSTEELTDIPLIWGFMICTVAIGYGFTVVCSELVGGFIYLLVFLKQRISGDRTVDLCEKSC